MKLHFYFLEDPYGREMYVRHEEAEADEGARSYILKEMPNSQYVERINKKDANGRVMEYGKKVILTERDDEKARQVFSEYYNLCIQKEEREIKRYKDIINAINKGRDAS